MTIPVPSGISARRGLHRVVVDAVGPRIVRGDLAAGAHRLVVEATGHAAPAGARESMEGLIASTARAAGSVVDVRPAIGRNT